MWTPLTVSLFREVADTKDPTMPLFEVEYRIAYEWEEEDDDPDGWRVVVPYECTVYVDGDEKKTPLSPYALKRVWQEFLKENAQCERPMVLRKRAWQEAA